MAVLSTGEEMISAKIDVRKPQDVVHIWVTPDDLRQLTDQAETAWKETRLGGDLCFFTLGTEGLIIRMTVDQARMK